MSEARAEAWAVVVVTALVAAPLDVGAQEIVPESVPDVRYMSLPRTASVELPPGFAAARREARQALGIASPREMVRLSHTERPTVEGERPVLVLPALFDDSPGPTVAADEIRRVLFEGPSDPGTITDFYAELSRGRLRITGEVAPWTRTRITLQEAAGTLNGHGWVGDSIQAYVKSAIERADPDVDFGRFDNDGPDGVPNSGDDDGRVDLLVIEFAEVAGSCDGPGIWPHAGPVRTGTADDPWEERRPVPTDDTTPSGEPVRVGAYLAQSATDCSGQEVHSINVLAHELGHLLGVGDYYEIAEGVEPEKRRWLVGCFGLMSAGSWGCGTGGKGTDFGPVHMSALTKSILGWMEVEDVPPGRDAVYTLEPAQTSGRALRIPMGTEAPAESFLVEYRPRLGFDRELPAGGILVYHQDRYDGPRQIADSLPRPAPFHLVEADGNHALLTVQGDGGDRGVAADVFARDGTVDSLTAATSPPARDHLGRSTAVTIHAMEIDDGRARVRVSYEPGFGAVKQNLPGRRRALTFYEGHFQVEGGEAPFEVRPTQGSELPEAIELSVEGRQVRVRGRLFEAGSRTVPVAIEDAAGRTAETDLTFLVDDLDLPRERLIEAALDPMSSGLSADEVRYLDASGHADGELDVADVRAALERRGLLAPPDADGGS